MLSTQQTNDPQVQRLLNRRQLSLKFLETRAEKFRSLVLQVRIRKLSHQYEHQLRVLWQGDVVHGFQIFEFRAVQLRGTLVIAAKKDDIEGKIDALKYQKDLMAPEEYRKQLQALLLELAKTQQELDK